MFICMLPQQPKSQLQNEHEWKKGHKTQNKAVYNIWVMINNNNDNKNRIVINIVITWNISSEVESKIYAVTRI